MKVLVIGSYGFIGKNVAQFIQSSQTYTMYECDIVVDYVKPNYFRIDATNADYHQIFQHTEFDICINCSGAASVPDSIVNPLRDFNLNTHNVFKLLDAIRIYQPNCKFINLSSAAVYGNPQRLPISEDFQLAPISPYGFHKMQAEQLCKFFNTYYQIATCSLRVFSAYGPELKKQLYWDLYHKAKGSDAISLFGTGRETRDFIYIDDVVKAIFCCIKNTKYEGECINIANGEAITINEAVSAFLDLFPTSKTLFFNGTVKAGDPLEWKADIGLLKTLGFQASFDLKEGLKRYYAWISQL